MTQDNKYNGWSNYETWLCNLWFDDHWADDAENCLEEARKDKDEATSLLASTIEEAFGEMVSEQMPSSNGFVTDIITSALREINYYEIAKAYIDEIEIENAA